MDKPFLKEWFGLSDSARRNIFQETAGQVGLPVSAVEKDWWVVRTLEMIFSLSCAGNIVFKGGTSLSKAWKLIERFSEDIDLALDKSFLGFGTDLSRSQILKLRKKSFAYLSADFLSELNGTFISAGFGDISMNILDTTESDQDPVIIEITYPSVTETLPYLKPRVIVEIGSRSLMEPFTGKPVCSFVGERFPDKPFADTPVMAPCVNPEKTFLEKLFLLHEEFSKPPDKIRVGGLSRHLYDIHILAGTQYDRAFADNTLYHAIVNHRQKFNPIRSFNYDNHASGTIRFIPPDSVIEDWEKDYHTMRENMIYGTSLPFADLIERLKELNARINAIVW